ncbi:MAG: DMT family transporter, partial [Boseongicola sp.]|nr:DMT family transporter [Boseongicola sp.]
ATVLSLLTIPFGWKIPSMTVLACLIGSGLLGGLGQILLTSAYRFGDASIVAPFEYASMLFAIAIGYAVFGEVPTFVMLLGASIVIASGVLIILREHYLKLQRGKGRQHVTKYG